ncbi:MAG: hypothetical protein ACP5PJ_08985, partial [Acidimicrobiales bacterium]
VEYFLSSNHDDASILLQKFERSQMNAARVGDAIVFAERSAELGAEGTQARDINILPGYLAKAPGAFINRVNCARNGRLLEMRLERRTVRRA